MLLHASVVDLFSPVQHINERNDLSKATSYSYVESEIALWRNTALSTCFFMLFSTCIGGDFGLGCTDIFLTRVSWVTDPGVHCGLWVSDIRAWAPVGVTTRIALWGMEARAVAFEAVCGLLDKQWFSHELSWTHTYQEEKRYYMHEYSSLPSFNLSHFLELPMLETSGHYPLSFA